MAFESNSFNVAKKYKLPEKEFTVDCNIPVESEVAKIFTVSAGVFVKTKEVLNGNINYAGEIETCVIYMAEDGEVNSTHHSCPFSAKFEDENILESQNVIIRVRVLNYTIKNVDNGTIAIAFELEQAGVVTFNQEVRSIAISDESINTREEDMMVVRIGEQTQSTIITNGVLNVREPIKKLLLCESQVEIKEITPGINFVTVIGEVVSRVLYLTENDRFESSYVFDNFKEEIEIESVTRDSQVEANGFICFNEVKAEVENTESGAKVELTVPVEIYLTSYEEENVKVISDLYSTENETFVVTESFDMTSALPIETVDGKVDGTLVIEDDKPRVDKILFTGGNFVNVTNIEHGDGTITVTGIARTNVVYLNDETNSIQSVELEVPFVLNNRTSFSDDADINAYVVISDVDVVVKKGRELFYDAKIKVVITANKQKIMAVITNANIAERLPEKDYALEVIFGKSGQNSWEIAKQNKIKEEILTRQNPDVIFPLLQDTQLVIYYQNLLKK